MAIKVSGTTVISDTRALQNITDVNVLIKKPTITAPTNGSTGFGSGSSFARVQLTGFSGLFTAQANIQIQIDNNSNFSSPYENTTLSSTSASYIDYDVSTWSVPVSTTVYIRARYSNSDGVSSDWSDTVSATTAATHAYVAKPTITSAPIGAATTATFQFETSAFSVQGGSSTHTSTDWQISTNSDFSTFIQNNSGDTTNKITWQNTTSFPVSSTVYVRARHNSSTLGSSDWTDTVQFVTPADFPGELVYTTPGTYNFVAPETRSDYCAVVVGGGGGGCRQHDNGGAGGGALSYKNNMSLSGSAGYTVVVGSGGTGATGGDGTAGGAGNLSSFINTATLYAAGGVGGSPSPNPGPHPATTGRSGDGGGDGGGGAGGSRNGSGGAGGYSGNGAYGTDTDTTPQLSSGGGGGASWNQNNVGGAGAGGVGLFGQGANGASGTGTTDMNGKGGSGGTDGGGGPFGPNRLSTVPHGGSYGGGGGSAGSINYGPQPSASGNGGPGAVRIMWGAQRSFPNNAPAS